MKKRETRSKKDVLKQSVDSPVGPVNIFRRRIGSKILGISLPADLKILVPGGKSLSGFKRLIETPNDGFEMTKCTPFQRRVLAALREIPPGRVSSYRGLAKRISMPGAARAVGTALAKNPFPLAFPCHRVVRSDGDLGGFGGGLKMKRALLEMEGVKFGDSKKVAAEYFLR